jgi:putative phosphoesterase
VNSVHRIALISDIHGNGIALREVVRAIEQRGADQIVCLGDVATLGVAPGEVIDRLRELGCACIRGNHDDYVLDPSLVDGHMSSSIILESIDWCRRQLTPEQTDFVRTFQDGIDLALGHHHTLTLFHGSPESNTMDLLADTPAEQFDLELGQKRSTVMAGGHTHIQMLRQHRGTLVVNPGSVGAAFQEFPINCRPTILPHAEYATVEARGNEVSVTLHRVNLDRRELSRAARASDNPIGRELAAIYV